MKFGRFFPAYVLAVLIWTLVLYMNTFFPHSFFVSLLLVPLSVWVIVLSTFFYFMTVQEEKDNQ